MIVPRLTVQVIRQYRDGRQWPMGCTKKVTRDPCASCGISDAEFCTHDTSEGHHVAMCSKCLDEHAEFYALEALVLKAAN